MTFSTLGTDTTTKQPVYLYKASRTQGLYIVGLQGMGKSGLLENLIIDDIKQGLGVCVLDPHGELIDHVIARLPGKAEEEKVIYLDLAEYTYPFGLNPFTCSNLNNPVEVEKTVDRVMHVFDKLLGVSDDTPLISQYLLHCTHTLVANPGYTMAEIPLLLTNDTSRQKLVANVKKMQTRLFWDEHYNPLPEADRRRERISTLRRVEKFLQDMTLPIVGQSISTIDMRKIMDESKILLVKLDRQMEQVTTLIGSIIVALILSASAARTTRKQFHLYADEFQRFATEDFATLLEEARKSGIGITMAHQNRAQLELSDKQVGGNLKARTLNVGSLVVFRVPTDAVALAGQFDTTPLPAELRPEVKLTPVSNPFDWLVSGHAHTSPVVNRYVDTTLRKIHVALSGEYAMDMRAELNSFLYRAMTSTDALSLLCEKSSLIFLLRLNDYYPFGRFYFGQTVASQPDKVTQTVSYTTSSDWGLRMVKGLGTIDNMPVLFPARDTNSPLDERMAIALIAIIQALGENQFIQASENFERLAEEKLRKQIASYLKAYEPIYRANKSTIDIYLKRSYFPPEQVAENWDKELERWMTEERAQFETFIREFRDFILALAKEPITSGSGIYEMKPVGQMTSDEMRNRIANELVQLPKYTARVKLTDAGDTIVEHTVVTREPEKGVYGRLLEDRIETIKLHTRTAGYTRPRQDVEVEIRMRQDALKQAQQPLVQKVPQPLQRRFLVCSKCGSQNRPGAKFCSHCGEKL